MKDCRLFLRRSSALPASCWLLEPAACHTSSPNPSQNPGNSLMPLATAERRAETHQPLESAAPTPDTSRRERCDKCRGFYGRAMLKYSRSRFFKWAHFFTNLKTKKKKETRVEYIAYSAWRCRFYDWRNLARGGGNKERVWWNRIADLMVRYRGIDSTSTVWIPPANWVRILYAVSTRC